MTATGQPADIGTEQLMSFAFRAVDEVRAVDEAAATLRAAPASSYSGTGYDLVTARPRRLT